MTCVSLRRDCKVNMNRQGAQAMTANLTEQGFLQLCSPECRNTFLRRWLQVHLQECVRIGTRHLHHPHLCRMCLG